MKNHTMVPTVTRGSRCRGCGAALGRWQKVCSVCAVTCRDCGCKFGDDAGWVNSRTFLAGNTASRRCRNCYTCRVRRTWRTRRGLVGDGVATGPRTGRRRRRPPAQLRLQVCANCRALFARPDLMRSDFCSQTCRELVKRSQARPKAPHHRGTFHRRAALVRSEAAANPSTQCWKCGLKLAEMPAHATGRPASWVAGHVLPGDLSSELRAECSHCSCREGAEVSKVIQQRKAAARRARVADAA